MLAPMNPRDVRIIHEEKIRKLERDIEYARIARERAAAVKEGSLNERLTWYAQAAQWMKEKVFGQAAVRQVSTQPEMMDVPCQCANC